MRRWVKNVSVAFTLSTGFLNPGCIHRNMPLAEYPTQINFEKYKLEAAGAACFIVGKAAVLTKGTLNTYLSYETGVTTGEPWLSVPLNVSDSSVVSLFSYGAVIYDKSKNQLIFVITDEKFMGEELTKIERLNLDKGYTKLLTPISGGICALVNENTGAVRIFLVSEGYTQIKGGFETLYEISDLGEFKIEKNAKIFGSFLSSIVVVEDNKISCYGRISCTLPTNLAVENVVVATLLYRDGKPTFELLDKTGTIYLFEVEK